MLSKNSNLLYLNLECILIFQIIQANLIGDEGWKILSIGLIQNKTLKKLGLKGKKYIISTIIGNGITNESVPFILKTLEKNTTLTTLILDGISFDFLN
jgi:hypothetical protein